jgi:hypothetical protein
MGAVMTEEILKIKAEELATIRLIFADSQESDGETVELTLSQAKTYADKSDDRNVRDGLRSLIAGLTYFSKKGVEPSVEFVIPLMR